ncbi:MAG: hypothetical protein ACQGVK_01650 [Myxococcota bacterium]
MIEERLEQAARLNDAMGNPLSRIQLAASELRRSVATPRDRDLLSRIGRAVGELDGLAQAVGSVLSPRPPGADALDLGNLLEELHDRLAPAVTALGFSWYPPDPPDSEAVGDPQRVRRAAVEMVRAATSRLDPGCGLRLGSRAATGRQEVVLAVEAEAASDAAGRLEGPTDELRRLLLSWDGALQLEQSGGEVRWVSWWPIGSPQ